MLLFPFNKKFTNMKCLLSPDILKNLYNLHEEKVGPEIGCLLL